MELPSSSRAPLQVKKDSRDLASTMPARLRFARLRVHGPVNSKNAISELTSLAPARLKRRGSAKRQPKREPTSYGEPHLAELGSRRRLPAPHFSLHLRIRALLLVSSYLWTGARHKYSDDVVGSPDL